MPPANYLAFSSFSSWSFAGSVGKASILDKEHKLSKLSLSPLPVNSRSEAAPHPPPRPGRPPTSPSWRLEATQTCPGSIWQFRFCPQEASRTQPRAAARSGPCPGQRPTPCPRAGRRPARRGGAAWSSAARPGGCARKRHVSGLKQTEREIPDTQEGQRGEAYPPTHPTFLRRGSP